MICYPAYPRDQPKRTDISGPQLAPLPESDHSFPRRDLQEHKVADLKLKLGPTSVRITLLTTLSGQQPLFDLLDLLCRLKHYLRTTHHALPYLTPANRGSTPPPIQQLKGRHANARMMAIVIRKLCQGKIRVPTPAEIQHTCSEHVLERLNRPLTLPVSLRVVCGTKMQFRTQFLMKLLPESGSETYISI